MSDWVRLFGLHHLEFHARTLDIYKGNFELFGQFSTCSPTLIFLVSAPSGKEAWTRGTVMLDRTPPSGPIWLLSCLIRDTTAKYCGKSFVMIRQICFFSRSAVLSSSVEYTSIMWVWFQEAFKLHTLQEQTKSSIFNFLKEMWVAFAYAKVGIIMLQSCSGDKCIAMWL